MNPFILRRVHPHRARLLALWLGVSLGVLAWDRCCESESKAAGRGEEMVNAHRLARR